VSLWHVGWQALRPTVNLTVLLVDHFISKIHVMINNCVCMQ